MSENFNEEELYFESNEEPHFMDYAEKSVKN